MGAKDVTLLGAAAKEAAVWTMDTAFARKAKTPALAAFEQFVRTSGSQVLVDVIRLGRYAREAPPSTAAR